MCLICCLVVKTIHLRDEWGGLILHANERSKGLPGRVFNYFVLFCFFGGWRGQGTTYTLCMHGQLQGQGLVPHGHVQDLGIWSLSLTCLSHISFFLFPDGLNSSMSLMFIKVRLHIYMPFTWWSWLKCKAVGMSEGVEATRRDPRILKTQTLTLITNIYIHCSLIGKQLFLKLWEYLASELQYKSFGETYGKTVPWHFASLWVLLILELLYIYIYQIHQSTLNSISYKPLTNYLAEPELILNRASVWSLLICHYWPPVSWLQLA